MVKIKGGKEKPKKFWKIDYKDEVENVLPIGHSDTNSKTFLPVFFHDKEEKVVYVDIAGLQDTSGENVEIINQLVNKYIFSKSQNLRILIPLSQNIIDSARGAGVQDCLNMLRMIYRGDLDAESLQPIVTKVPVNEAQQLYKIKENVRGMIEQCIQNFNNSKGLTQDMI